MNRRELLKTGAIISAVGLSGCIGTEVKQSGNRSSKLTSTTTVGIKEVATGFTQPVAVEFPKPINGIYVADKLGKIWFDHSIQNDRLEFLDLSDNLLSQLSNWETGLLGFTLHPEFAKNRKFYVRYSAPLRRNMPNHFSHTFVLSEFQCHEDYRHVNPETERIILEIPQPGEFHQSGGIVFGPDKYLYVAVGDGGGTNDSVFSGFRDTGPGHANDWYWLNRGGNGQDITENLLGSILRIDVNNRSNRKPYSIPSDNPLIGKKGLDEQFAWGFRNPYRLSFDGNRLFVADVGHNSYEEVNIVKKGGNYGWNVKEGPNCYNANSAFIDGLQNDTPGFIFPFLFSKPPFSLIDKIVDRVFDFEELPVCPSESPRGNSLRDPVIVYPHVKKGRAFGSAGIGGYAYRNSTIQKLQDKFVFGDLTGGVYASTLNTDQKSPWPIQDVTILDAQDQPLSQAILSFGRDPVGELYIMTTEFSKGSGSVFKLVPRK